MDYSRLDRVRRSATPLELDLVEAFAQGRITRRQFIQRGTVIGLSLRSISAVIAACSSTPPTSTAPSAAASASGEPSAAGSGASRRARRRHDQDRHPESRVKLDPIAMQDLGALRHHRPVLRVPVHARSTSGDIAPGLAESSGRPTPTARSGRSSCARASSGRTAPTSRRPTSPPRWTACRGRQLRPEGRHRGRARWTRPTRNTVDVHPRSAPNGNFPYLVSVFNAQSVITPAAYATGHDARRHAERHRRLEADKLRPADRRRVRAQRRLVGRRDAARRHASSMFFDEPGRWSRPTRAARSTRIVQFQVLGGEALFDDPNFNVIGFQAATHRQIWMRCDTGQFADKRVRQALALTFDRAGADQTAVQGQGRPRQRPRHRPDLPVLRRQSVPQRDARHREGQAAARRRRRPDDLRRTLHAGDLQEIPELAPAHPEPGRGGRLHARARRESRHVLRRAVVPRRTRRPAVLRRGRARHRRLRPPRHARRVPQRRAQDEGHLELVPVLLAGVRRRVQGVPGGDRRRRARRRPARRSRRSSTRTSRSACRTSTTTSPAARRSSRASGLERARADVPRLRRRRPDHGIRARVGAHAPPRPHPSSRSRGGMRR